MNVLNLIKPCSIVFGILMTSIVTSQATVTFFIKQVVQGPDGEDVSSTDVYVENDDLLTENKSSTGDHQAVLAIGEYGSTFYLYVQGLNDPDGAPVLLDEKFIGNYVASADLLITSADSYSPPRTRADQPYTVTVKSWNQNWAEAQSMSEVPQLGWNPLNMGLSASYDYEEDSESHGIHLDTDTTDDLPLDDGLGNTTLITLQMTTDGISQTNFNTLTLDGLSANILPVTASPDEFPYTELSSVRGKETYKIHAQSGIDANGEIIWKTVGQKSIQIWPLAQATIADGVLKDGDRITRSMPDLQVKFWDLYPNSTTYVTIYKGDPASIDAPTQVPVYTSRQITINQDIPLCDTIAISNWDQYITDDGQYSIEVSTITPFNNGQPERLLAFSFEVDRKIEFVGSTTTSE